MKTVFYSVVLSLMISTGGVVKAGDMATEKTQMANGFITAALAILEEAIKTINDIQLTLDQLNTLDLADMAFDKFPGLKDMFALFADIENIINKGEALAHTSADLEKEMKKRFKDYESYYDEIVTDGGIIRQKFEDRYKRWSETHNDTIRNILESGGFHADEFATDQARLNVLQGRSTNSEGRMQAIQVGNEIAIEETKQLGKLREIVLEQTSLHASYFAQKQARQAKEDAATTWATNSLRATILDDAPIAFK